MTERHPYRIIRGSYSRRDGEQRVRFDDNGKPVGKYRPFVHYSAKTDSNPNARDQIELTDEEARAFGLHKLERLVRSNISTKPERVSKGGVIIPPTVELEETDEESSAPTLEDLIAEGENVRGAVDLREFRRKVTASGILGDNVPTRKGELLDALRSATA